MAYDLELSNRLREALAGEDGVSERAMFGGLAFLVHGHLAVSAGSQADSSSRRVSHRPSTDCRARASRRAAKAL